jgi:DNA polymerase epsilon subunit 2
MVLNSKVKVKRAIYTIFTKKYGLHVQTDATKYLESLLEDETDLADKLEKIIKAYKKRYSGKLNIQ